MVNKGISIIMAFICNPYLAVLQKQTYLKYWKDEVDEVLLNINGRNEKIRKFIIDLWKDDKVKVCTEMPAEVRQGVAFDGLMPAVEGKILMTMDSDNFIYSKGIIDAYSGMILGGKFDAIGSKGFHAKPANVAKGLTLKYGTVRLNPFMSFWNMEVVHKINNLTFKNFSIEQGESLRFTGIAEERITLDVMGFFTLQVLEKTNKVHFIDSVKEGKYVHVGALSSIFRRNFRGLENYNVTNYEVSELKQHSGYLLWYYLIYEATKKMVPDEFNKAYENNYLKEIKKIGLELKDAILLSERMKQDHINLFV